MPSEEENSSCAKEPTTLQDYDADIDDQTIRSRSIDEESDDDDDDIYDSSYQHSPLRRQQPLLGKIIITTAQIDPFTNRAIDICSCSNIDADDSPKHEFDKCCTCRRTSPNQQCEQQQYSLSRCEDFVATSFHGVDQLWCRPYSTKADPGNAAAVRNAEYNSMKILSNVIIPSDTAYNNIAKAAAIATSSTSKNMYESWRHVSDLLAQYQFDTCQSPLSLVSTERICKKRSHNRESCFRKETNSCLHYNDDQTHILPQIQNPNGIRNETMDGITIFNAPLDDDIIHGSNGISMHDVLKPLRIEDAMALSKVPHVLIEAMEPYRVVHTNAAFHEYKQLVLRTTTTTMTTTNDETSNNERSGNLFFLTDARTIISTMFGSSPVTVLPVQSRNGILPTHYLVQLTSYPSQHVDDTLGVHDINQSDQDQQQHLPPLFNKRMSNEAKLAVA
jgi:hypothetical protein